MNNCDFCKQVIPIYTELEIKKKPKCIKEIRNLEANSEEAKNKNIQSFPTLVISMHIANEQDEEVAISGSDAIKFICNSILDVLKRQKFF